MANLDILFTKGQSEAADPKVLPQGTFSSLVNMRYRKDGRLGLRYGYAFDATSGHPTPNNVIASAAFDSLHLVSLIARPNYAYPVTGTKKTRGTYSPTDCGPMVGDWASCELVRKWGTTRNQANSGDTVLSAGASAASTDCALNGTTLVCPEIAYTVGTNTAIAGVPSIVEVDAATGLGPPDTFGGAQQGTNAKVVVVAGVTCVFYANSFDQIRMQRLDTHVVATVATATAGRAPYFDVSAGGSASEAYLIYPSAANTLAFGTVDVTGVFAALNTIATTGAEARPSITPTFGAPADDIAIVWNDGATFLTGNCKFTVYRRSTGLFPTATTTMDASGLNVGYPVIGQHLVLNWVAASNRSAASAITASDAIVFNAFTVVGSPVVYSGMAAVSKPFNASPGNYVIMTDRDADVLNPATYYVINTTNNFPAAFSVPYSTSDGQFYQSPIVFALTIAKRADTASTVSDPRRKVAAVTAVGDPPGLTAMVCFLPIVAGLQGGFALFRFERGANGIISTATLNRTLYFAGSRVCQYDGDNIVPVGFAGIPNIVSTATFGGPVAAGTYQYVVVWEFVDRFGFVQRSPPSLPVTVVLGAPSTVSVYFSGLMWGVFSSNNTIVARCYRTQAGATVFQEISTSPSAASTTGGVQQFTDVTTDAAIASRPVLYTQGARGGLSGIHEDDAPPPALFITAGSSRLMLGGMEDPSQVQWSKLQFDGEPMTFANDPQWRATVDGRITAVSEIDGTWLIFTRDSIWTVAGDGPDDAGAGSFAAPVRQPSSVGCISHKSIVRFGNGLIFQSARGFELMPRGGGEPQWIGQTVRDTLAAFPYVTAAAFNQVEQVCYWAVCDTAATTGRLIVYDTRIGQWYVDTYYSRVIKALAVYDGKLVIDGGLFETAAFTDDDTGAKTTAILPLIVTGDIRPFGVTGWGQFIKDQILGELRDVATAWSLTQDVSYDSGKTFAETATWPVASLGAAIGDAVDGAEHYFVTQRCDSVRIRLSWTTPSPTEGMVFNSLQLQVIPADGLKRGANSMRAA